VVEFLESDARAMNSNVLGFFSGNVNRKCRVEHASMSGWNLYWKSSWKRCVGGSYTTMPIGLRVQNVTTVASLFLQWGPKI